MLVDCKKIRTFARKNEPDKDHHCRSLRDRDGRAA